MKSTVMWALIALNAMLATTFVLRMVKPNVAYAQNNRPGDYIMLPGNAIGQAGAMIYIIDQSSQQLSGLVVDQQGRLNAVKPIDLQHAFNNADGGPGKKPGRK